MASQYRGDSTGLVFELSTTAKLLIVKTVALRNVVDERFPQVSYEPHHPRGLVNSLESLHHALTCLRRALHSEADRQLCKHHLYHAIRALLSQCQDFTDDFKSALKPGDPSKDGQDIDPLSFEEQVATYLAKVSRFVYELQTYADVVSTAHSERELERRLNECEKDLSLDITRQELGRSLQYVVAQKAQNDLDRLRQRGSIQPPPPAPSPPPTNLPQDCGRPSKGHPSSVPSGLPDYDHVVQAGPKEIAFLDYWVQPDSKAQDSLSERKENTENEAAPGQKKSVSAGYLRRLGSVLKGSSKPCDGTEFVEQTRTWTVRGIKQSCCAFGIVKKRSMAGLRVTWEVSRLPMSEIELQDLMLNTNSNIWQHYWKLPAGCRKAISDKLGFRSALGDERQSIAIIKTYPKHSKFDDVESVSIVVERQDTAQTQQSWGFLKNDSEIITLLDPTGRLFNWPWERVKTWEGLTELLEQAFQEVDQLGDHVRAGHFNIFGPGGECILPSVWQETVRPGWFLKMHMWEIENSYLEPAPTPPLALRQYDPFPRPLPPPFPQDLLSPAIPKSRPIIIEESRSHVPPHNSDDIAPDLLISNIDAATTEEEVLELLRPRGTVKACQLSRDEKNPSKATMLVEMSSGFEVDAVLADFHHTNASGQALRIEKLNWQPTPLPQTSSTSPSGGPIRHVGLLDDVYAAGPPFWPRISKRDIEHATLEYYDLPWTESAEFPHSVVIRQELSEADLNILFEHSRRHRRSRGLPVSPNPDPPCVYPQHPRGSLGAAAAAAAANAQMPPFPHPLPLPIPPPAPYNCFDNPYDHFLDNPPIIPRTPTPYPANPFLPHPPISPGMMTPLPLPRKPPVSDLWTKVPLMPRPHWEVYRPADGRDVLRGEMGGTSSKAVPMFGQGRVIESLVDEFVI